MAELPEENPNPRRNDDGDGGDGGGASVVAKRQRRPSVRLGDLGGGGDLISTYYYDPFPPPHKRRSFNPRRQPPSKTRQFGNLKVSKETISDAANDVNNDKNRGRISSKSKKNVKKLRKKIGSGEHEADSDGVAIGSWKASASALRGGRIGGNGKRGDVDSLGFGLVDGKRNENNESDLDGVAIGSWKGRDLVLRGRNGERGGVDNLGSKLVDEELNERGEDGVNRNFEPLRSEEDDEDGEENHDDSSPVDLLDKDNSGSDDVDGNGNVNGGKGDRNGVEKGRNGKNLRFQVSDEMGDPSDISERNGVKVWLKKLGLQRYAPIFEIHEVDDEVLPLLTLEDLKDMGITAVGSRRKMFCSIQNLNK